MFSLFSARCTGIDDILYFCKVTARTRSAERHFVKLYEPLGFSHERQGTSFMFNLAPVIVTRISTENTN